MSADNYSTLIEPDKYALARSSKHQKLTTFEAKKKEINLARAYRKLLHVIAIQINHF
jgi:hypothetical protein